MALDDLFNHPHAEKFIANPVEGSGYFTANDSVILRHMPRETFEGSGEYKIYQYYEVESLQALLKMDFYKALEVGYIIRKCEYCGRYFLLKKGYHTKYCDNPAPDNPKYTCAQLGYHCKGIKELQADNPQGTITSPLLSAHRQRFLTGSDNTRRKIQIIPHGAGLILRCNHKIGNVKRRI
jgi:hypothetical protein